MDGFYGSIIKLAPSGRQSEGGGSGQGDRNTQRDLNMLVNELAVIFRQLGIDTLDVLGCRRQMEFPGLSAGAGGRPLHRRGSLLPHIRRSSWAITRRWCWLAVACMAWDVG